MSCCAPAGGGGPARRLNSACHRLTVAPRRLRRFRINDLIFPQAVLLAVPYALQMWCDVPIVVQFGRQDTLALVRLVEFFAR